MLGDTADITVKVVRKLCFFRKMMSLFWCPYMFNCKDTATSL